MISLNNQNLHFPNFNKLVEYTCGSFIASNSILSAKELMPNFKLTDFPDLTTHNIKSREFTTVYIDKLDEVGGNLYYWIHQSFNVLFEVKAENRQVVLFSSTILKLGSRFATLLKMDKKTAIEGVYSFCIKMALIEFFKNTVVFTQQQVDAFFENEDQKRIQAKFKSMFQKDVVPNYIID